VSRRENIERLLNPRSIVFVGGQGLHVAIKAARSIGYAGDLWVVNPKHAEIGGVATHASLADLPGTPDAAFLGVRAQLSIDALRELAGMGCAGAVCYAAGFGESGRPDLQRALREAAGDMAVVGPNCYGVLNYLDGVALWPDFHGGRRVERGAAVVSQSGNLSLILTMAARGLPIATVISTGNQAVLEASDYVDVLVDDPRVSAIGLYVEGLRDLPKFWRAALRALRRGTPIVALKAGASDIGQRMTLSHTSSLAGSDAMYQALFDQLGVVRVDSIPELIESLKLFCVSGPFEGRRLGVLTCSGADSAMMADRAAAVNVELPPLSEAQMADMREYMAEFVNLTNPLDFNTQVWGKHELEVRCFSSVMRGDQYDVTAIVHDYPAPECSDFAAWDGVCNSFIEAHRITQKPAVLLSNFGEMLPDKMLARLCENGVTPLGGLQEGTLAIQRAGWYGERRARLLAAGDLERSMLREPAPIPGSATLLDEWESKQRLAACGLRVPAGRRVCAADAGETAEALGFPVAVKRASAALAHKTEAGAVKLGLESRAEVERAVAEIRESLRDRPDLEDAYLVEQMVRGSVAELIIGLKRDEQFGPVLVIGSGGVLVNLIRDSATLLLPVRRERVEEALRSLAGFKLLDGYRGKPRGDIEAVIDAVLAVADFAERHFDRVLELDVNPLMVLPAGEGAIAADALIRMADGD